MEQVSGIKIKGNFIGTSKEGDAKIGNGYGLLLLTNTPSNEIGGIEDGEGNLISGNKEDGIQIYGTSSTGNEIFGNKIGINFEATEKLGNEKFGIHLLGTTGNWIGKTDGGGNIISGNNFSGVRFTVSHHNYIMDNLIGTNEADADDLGNEAFGIDINFGSYQNFIGGYRDGDQLAIKKNVVSGNILGGIGLFGQLWIASVHRNYILGNYIGTTIDGNKALGNHGDGIKVQFEHTWSNYIGVLATDWEGKSFLNGKNVIAGNKGHGVSITDQAHNIIVMANYIGTNADGTAAVPNEGAGIAMSNKAKRNFIGGWEEGDYIFGIGNLISGNLGSGILLEKYAILVSVFNNKIGTKADPKNPLGNQRHGIEIRNGGGGAVIGELLGGINIISGNQKSGISMSGSNTFDNKIFNNRIGIDIENNIVPNQEHGVVFADKTHDNIIGFKGLHTVAPVTIAGNKKNGIVLTSGAYENEIGGATIGVSPKMTFKIPNEGYGIEISDGANNNVFGTGRIKELGNVVGGNLKGGIYIQGEKTTKNHIGGNYIGVSLDEETNLNNQGYGITVVEKCIYNEIVDNTIWYNEGGVKGKHTNNKFSGNSVKYNTKNTGFHLDSAFSVIIGNEITGDEGDGIFCENGANPTVVANNIYDNFGYGIDNSDNSIQIEANNNWWGDASGPGGEGAGNGDEINGQVSCESWLAESVRVIALWGALQEYVAPGAVDSTFYLIKNFTDQNDIISVTVSDSNGWIESTSYNLEMDADEGLDTSVLYTVPVGIQAGTKNKLYLSAQSQNNPGIFFYDTLLMTVYEQQIASFSIIPDSMNIFPDDSLVFEGLLLDQFNNELISNITWEAEGGIIRTNGIFVASDVPGEYFISATENGSQLSDTVTVNVLDQINEKSIYTKLDISPDSVSLFPGDSLHFDAILYDQYGDTLDSEVSWNASGGGIIDDDGLFIAGEIYGEYLISANDNNSGLRDSVTVFIVDVTMIREIKAAPKQYILSQNYPNPFNEKTTIGFSIPEGSKVKLEIYNLLGRRVDTLIDKYVQAGAYRIPYDGKKLSSGIYLIRLSTPRYEKSVKMILMK